MFFIWNNKIIKKRLTSKSSQNEEAALEIYHLKITIESYEDKLKASKSANAEQLTSFQEEIKGKEELIQELQSIIKGKILGLTVASTFYPVTVASTFAPAGSRYFLRVLVHFLCALFVFLSIFEKN